jgi:hypothetical protein
VTDNRYVMRIFEKLGFTPRHLQDKVVKAEYRF